MLSRARSMRSFSNLLSNALNTGRIGLAVLALLLCPAVWGQDVPEYRLKAAFLYNFAAFTEWPAEVGATLKLCLFGSDPFGSEIDSLNGKAVGTRAVEVQRKTGLEGLKGCQLLFVAASHAGQLQRVADAVHGTPVLVVADSAGATRQGAALNMNISQGRVSFEANLAAARGNQLKLSANLLRLATEVIR